MEYKKFLDLSDEDKLKIIKAKQENRCEYLLGDGYWEKAYGDHVYFDTTYRIKPVVKKSMGYRRFLWLCVGSPCVSIVLDAGTGAEAANVEKRGAFIKWIDTEWQYETYEEEQ